MPHSRFSLSRFCHVLVLVLGLAATCPVTGARGQIIRPPELSNQFHRAETAWRSGTSMLEAKARVDRVLEKLPDDVQALKLRAQVLLALDRPREALADARRAVALQHKDGEAYLILCEAARRTEDLSLAEEALDAAAELVLDDPVLHVRLSWNAVLLNQLDKAEAFARIAMALDPNDASAYYQLARVFILKNQVDDAATIVERGLRASILDPIVIATDSTLARLVDHALVEPLLAQ